MPRVVSRRIVSGGEPIAGSRPAAPFDLVSLGLEPKRPGEFEADLVSAQAAAEQPLPEGRATDEQLRRIGFDDRVRELRSRSANQNLGRTFVRNIPRVLGGVVGGVAGSAAGSFLGPVGGVAGGLAGAAAGSAATDAALRGAEALLTSPEEEQAAEEARRLDELEYPFSTFVAETLPSMVYARPSLTQAKRAIRLLKLLANRDKKLVQDYMQQHPEAAYALINMGIGVGVGAGGQAFAEYSRALQLDEGERDLLSSFARVVAAGVVGGVFVEPNRIGRAIGLQGSREILPSKVNAAAQAVGRGALQQLSGQEVDVRLPSVLAPIRQGAPEVPRASRLNQTKDLSPAEAQMKINNLTEPKVDTPPPAEEVRQSQPLVDPFGEPLDVPKPRPTDEDLRIMRKAALEEEERIIRETEALRRRQVVDTGQELVRERNQLLSKLGYTAESNPYRDRSLRDQILALSDEAIYRQSPPSVKRFAFKAAKPKPPPPEAPGDENFQRTQLETEWIEGVPPYDPPPQKPLIAAGKAETLKSLEEELDRDLLARGYEPAQPTPLPEAPPGWAEEQLRLERIAQEQSAPPPPEPVQIPEKVVRSLKGKKTKKEPVQKEELPPETVAPAAPVAAQQVPTPQPVPTPTPTPVPETAPAPAPASVRPPPPPLPTIPESTPPRGPMKPLLVVQPNKDPEALKPAPAKQEWESKRFRIPRREETVEDLLGPEKSPDIFLQDDRQAAEIRQRIAGYNTTHGWTFFDPQDRSMIALVSPDGKVVVRFNYDFTNDLDVARTLGQAKRFAEQNRYESFKKDPQKLGPIKTLEEAASLSKRPKLNIIEQSRLDYLTKKKNLDGNEETERDRLMDRSGWVVPAKKRGGETSPLKQDLPTPEETDMARKALGEGSKPSDARKSSRKGSSGLGGEESKKGAVFVPDLTPVMEVVKKLWKSSEGNRLLFSKKMRDYLGGSGGTIISSSEKLMDALFPLTSKEGIKRTNQLVEQFKELGHFSRESGKDAAFDQERLKSIANRINKAIPEEKKRFKDAEEFIRWANGPVGRLAMAFYDRNYPARSLIDIKGVTASLRTNPRAAFSDSMSSARTEAEETARSQIMFMMKTLFEETKGVKRNEREVLADLQKYMHAEHAPYYNEAAVQRYSKKLNEAAERTRLEPEQIDDILSLYTSLERSDLFADEFQVPLKDFPKEEFADLVRAKALSSKAAGITNEEAFRAIDQLRADYGDKFASLEKAGEIVKKINREALLLLRSNGLISPKTYDTLIKRYPNYVPLKRVFELEDDPIPSLDPRTNPHLYSDRAYVRKNSAFVPLKYADGSERLIDDIITNTLDSFQNAVEAAYSNRYFNRLAAFVSENEAFWKYKDYEGKERELLSVSSSPLYPSTPVQGSGGSIKFFANYGGEITTKYINVADPLLFNSLTLGTDSQGAVTRMLNLLGVPNRYLGRIYTTFNIAFSPANFVRDTQDLFFNIIEQTGDVGLAKRALFNNIKNPFSEDSSINVATTYYLLRNKGFVEHEQLDEAGLSPEKLKLVKMFKDFITMGGGTGGYVRQTKEQTAEDVESMVNRLAPGYRPDKIFLSQVSKVKDFFELWSNIFENASRFSVYRSAMEAGLDQRAALQLSRQATIDFNRRGEFAKVLSSYFLFFNPGVQGVANLVRALRNPKTLAILGSSMAGAVAMVSEFNDWVQDSYNGSINPADRKLDWVRDIPSGQRNGALVVLNPVNPVSEDGKVNFISIPISYSFRPVLVVSGVISDLLNGRDIPAAIEDVTTLDAQQISEYRASYVSNAIGRFSSVVLDAFSPVGETGNPYLSMVPSFTAPLFEVGLNKTALGRAIMPETFNKMVPASELYFPNLEKSPSGRTLIQVSDILGKELQDIGFHELAASKFMSPAAHEHLISSYLGGLYIFPRQVIDSMIKVLSQEDLSASDIPIVSRFVRGYLPEQVVRYDVGVPQALRDEAMNTARESAQRTRSLKRVSRDLLTAISRAGDDPIRRSEAFSAVIAQALNDGIIRDGVKGREDITRILGYIMDARIAQTSIGKFLDTQPISVGAAYISSLIQRSAAERGREGVFDTLRYIDYLLENGLLKEAHLEQMLELLNSEQDNAIN